MVVMIRMMSGRTSVSLCGNWWGIEGLKRLVYREILDTLTLLFTANLKNFLFNNINSMNRELLPCSKLLKVKLNGEFL